MEDYVTFEQAQRLKELGFDWECQGAYLEGKSEFKLYDSMATKDWNEDVFDFSIPTPTLSQSQKWLREVKDIIIGIDFDNWYEKYVCHVYKKIIYNSENIKDSYGSMLVTNESNEDFDTYEQSLSAGIDKALELLK